MFHRADKKTLPIAFIPKGKSNDICSDMSIESVDRALDFIIKGQVIKLDLIEALIDYENEESVPIEDYMDH